MAYPGLFWRGVDLEKKNRGGGLPPRKLITFDPFVNCIMVILVIFLDVVNFFPSLFTFFFSDYAHTPAPPAYALNHHYHFNTSVDIDINQILC